MSITYPLAEAFRRGWRDGRQEIGTEYIFVELAGRLKLPRPRTARSYKAYANSLRSDSSGRSAGAEHPVLNGDDWIRVEVHAALREAAWMGSRSLRKAARGRPPTWGSDVADALFRALMDAREVGVTQAYAVHLLVALVSDQDSRACRLLSTVRLEPQRVFDELPVGKLLRDDGEPVAHALNALRLFGALSGASAMLRLIGQAREILDACGVDIVALSAQLH